MVVARRLGISRTMVRLFGAWYSFEAVQFFGRPPPTRGPPVHPLAAHARELAESFKTSYGRPRADNVVIVSIILRRFGGAQNTRSPFLCCLLSAVHACTTRPSRPRDAPMYPARGSPIFSWCSRRTGAASLHFRWQPLRAASTAVVPLPAAGVHVRRARQVQPGQPLLAPTGPPCVALGAHGLAVRVTTRPLPCPCSGASTRPASCRPCCSWSPPPTRSQASSAAERKLLDRF